MGRLVGTACKHLSHIWELRRNEASRKTIGHQKRKELKKLNLLYLQNLEMVIVMRRWNPFWLPSESTTKQFPKQYSKSWRLTRLKLLQQIAEANQAQAAAASAQADLLKQQHESSYLHSLPDSEFTLQYKQMSMEELMLAQGIRNEKLRKEHEDLQKS